MIRFLTAVLALIAIVAAPIAPIACVTRCQFSLRHQHSDCTEGAHAHTHHHVRAVNQETQSDVAAHYRNQSAYGANSVCPPAGCANLGIPVWATRAATVPIKLVIPLSLSPAAVANAGRTSISSRNTVSRVGPGPEGSAPSISAPLRI